MNPWKEFSMSDLAAATNQFLVPDPDVFPGAGSLYLPLDGASLSSMLLTVAQRRLNSEQWEDVKDEIDDWAYVEEVISQIAGDAPVPLVMCSVTDSMVSGAWGLSSLGLSNRGVVYYRPDWGTDDDQSLPVLGGWEPINNQHVRRECILRVYEREWKHRGLPPAMGQWARGDPQLLYQTISRVLHADPKEWKKVCERVHAQPEVINRDPETIKLLSELCRCDPSRVQKVLNLTSGTFNRKLLSQLAGHDGNLLVAVYVWCIGLGGFEF